MSKKKADAKAVHDKSYGKIIWNYMFGNNTAKKGKKAAKAVTPLTEDQFLALWITIDPIGDFNRNFGLWISIKPKPTSKEIHTFLDGFIKELIREQRKFGKRVPNKNQKAAAKAYLIQQITKPAKLNQELLDVKLKF